MVEGLTFYQHLTRGQRVRDGNGYGLSARVTGIRCVWTCRQRLRSGPWTRRAPEEIFDLRVSQSWMDRDPSH